MVLSPRALLRSTGEQSGHWVWAHPWAQIVHGCLALTDTGQQQRLLAACSGSTGREALIRNGMRPRSLRIRRLGVRIPPGALCVETDDQALTSGNAGWGLCRVEWRDTESHDVVREEGCPWGHHHLVSRGSADRGWVSLLNSAGGESEGQLVWASARGNTIWHSGFLTIRLVRPTRTSRNVPKH